MARARVLFLTVMPSPYQQELFRAMRSSGDFDVEVRYYASGAIDRQWAAPALSAYERVLPGRAMSWLWPSAHLNGGVISAIAADGNRLVVISDYSALSAQLAMWYLWLRGRPWVYWGEMPGMRPGRLNALARAILMLPLRRSVTAVAAVGSRAGAVYRRLLGQRVPVFNVPYFCELDRFLRAPRVRKDESSVTLLFSGQFIHRKGLDVLLAAFVRVADKAPSLRLLLAGGDADSEFLRVLPPALEERLDVRGFVQPAELPSLFTEADIFVLPSRHDGWGLVVNEALGAGLPIIVSDAVGAGWDLVIEGENGFRVPAGDPDRLAEAILRLAASADLRRKFSAASTALARRFDIDEGVRRWRDVCAAVEDRAA